MQQLRIVITDAAGTMLDTTEVEIEPRIAADAALLRTVMAVALKEDINWNRISNLIDEEG
jgi:hypothetical protein